MVSELSERHGTSEPGRLVPLGCRGCGQPDLHTVLALGNMPLANALRGADQLGVPERTYPLEVVFCPKCTLLQLTETVDPEILFREYVYLSSFSDTMLAHAQTLAERLIRDHQLTAQHRVVEIASNDGYLLRHYRRQGVGVLGIEPALNVACVAREEHGIPTLAEFFRLELAEQLRAEGIQADVLHAHNVLAHVADLHGVVAGMRCLLAETGILVVEVPYVGDLIAHVEFDTIYHEHLCYFSLTALEHLFARHDLTVCAVERLAIHGGSLRLFIRHAPAAAQHAPDSTLEALRAQEQQCGMTALPFYASFAQQVWMLCTELTQLLRDLKRQGKRIVGYGASAKGTTLLNACGLGCETLDYLVDRSPIKQLKLAPGTGLPILSPERLLADMPDYVLLLTWNFADEILYQQQAYRDRGGRFILPIPEIRIL